MKVKDHKGNLGGIKVKTPKGVIGYWKSQWQKGVWLNQSTIDSRQYPQFVDDLKDCLDWEITEEKVNCHIRNDYKSIDNTLKK